MNARLNSAVLMLFFLMLGERAWAGQLHPAVEERLLSLQTGSLLSVIVEMEDQADLQSVLAGVAGKSRHERTRDLIEALKQVANRTQGPVRGMLQRELARGAARSVTAFWVFNGFAVSATESVIRSLAGAPGVREVRLDRRIPQPFPRPAAVGDSSPESEWNIARIRAPESWALGPIYDGTSVVIGSFDTGVDFTHPDLATRYRGDHSISWFDPYGEHDAPFDAHGHGTHTTGTAIGGNASGFYIGVAPGAKWIAAKGWSDLEIATASAFHRIFEWFLAPGGDPANAPDVVISSWVMDVSYCDTEFLMDIRAWRAAGIFPAFASGNTGPDPGSVDCPGAYAESFAVGATGYFDEIAWFSGRGPSPCNQIFKPDITAPGDFITSAIPGGYASLSGTSMATPHVAGAVAVLRSIKPDATVEELESVLREGATDLGAPGVDNDFGAGRLDLYVSAQILLLGSDFPRVKVVASAGAAEAGATPGAFTLTRTGSTDETLTVNYTITGTAQAGSDYIALTGTATFAAGAADTIIFVTPIDDPVVEYGETVVLTLSPSNAYIVASPDSAAVTIISDELFPDLAVYALSAPTGAGAGEAIAVSDTIKNQGSGPADPSVTRFYLSGDALIDAGDVVLGTRTVPGLAPGASNSTPTSLTIPPGTAIGPYYILAKADGDNLLLESNEGNNTLARSIQLGPDLTVTVLSAPGASGAGAAINITDTVKNQGGGAAAASVIRFFLSDDRTLDPADAILGTRTVPALSAAGTSSGSTVVNIPAGTPSGDRYIIARADADDAVAETQEGNNTILRTVMIGPDLTVAAFTSPASSEAGGIVTVSDTVKNQGGGAAEASVTQFFLSTNTSVDPADTPLGSRAVPALTAGAANSGSITLTIPMETPTGTYYLIAKADGADAVVETNEANNTYPRSLQISPDLTFAALSAPSVAGAGAAVTITDTVKNQGGAPAGTSVVRYFLSGNSTFDPADAEIGSRAVPALPAGATNPGSASVVIPAGTPTGAFYLIARADADNAVAETQEGNNTIFRSIAIGPDLIVSALASSDSGQAGGTVTASETVRNQGGGAAEASVTRYFLSLNTSLGPEDLPLGSRAVPALAPGAFSSGSAALTIPPETSTGSYYIIAVADGGETLVETNEGNNTSARSIQVGPDLTVTVLTIPSTAGAGVSLTITDTVKNQGGASAAVTEVKYFLSADNMLDPEDVVLGSRSVPALAAGAANTGSAVAGVPADTPTGARYIIARADAYDVVAETREDNNVLYRTIAIGPDLTVSTFSSPSTGGAGVAVNTSDTVRNQGGGAAAASMVRFYLSSNSSLDPADLAVGARAVPALAPGASHAGSAALAIPPDTATAIYYLIAKADGENLLLETNESNNTYVRGIRIGPDLTIASFTAPSASTAGAAVIVTETTRNTGGGQAPATVTRYYLSTTNAVGADALLLGGRDAPALAPGASQSGSTSLTVPAGTAAGTYYIIAKADGDNAVIEVYESNNTYARTIRIASGP
ncbi:MAG: peptidase [Acidobacteria bacterium]|nr:peptidase [Acidobacteriota bacterium]